MSGFGRSFPCVSRRHCARGSRSGSPTSAAKMYSCRREFRDLGGEDQVLRVLRILVREKRRVRIGYGVYGREVVSRLSGDPILYSRSGFLGAARQALTKLGVKWEPSEAEREYNEGRSTQIPVNPVVRVKGRFSRRLRDGKQEVVLAR